MEVLNPVPGRPFGDSNNDSVAVRLRYGTVSVLLAADMEDEAELRLIDSGSDISSTVLKAGHHGSDTSSSQAFLDAVGPEIAVVSAGLDNQYGHPAPQVLERLEASRRTAERVPHGSAGNGRVRVGRHDVVGADGTVRAVRTI